MYTQFQNVQQYMDTFANSHSFTTVLFTKNAQVLNGISHGVHIKLTLTTLLKNMIIVTNHALMFLVYQVSIAKIHLYRCVELLTDIRVLSHLFFTGLNMSNVPVSNGTNRGAHIKLPQRTLSKSMIIVKHHVLVLRRPR